MAGGAVTAPRIGVTSSRGGGRYMWWFYWLTLRLLGERPLRLVPADDVSLVDGLQGLVVGGGDDIGAEIYQGLPTPDVRIDPQRDRLELRALEHAARHDIPVLGICRGAQMLNVFYGGSLHQDIYAAYEGLRRRWTPLPVKHVTVEAGSFLERILDRDRLKVNSLHTQSVDRLGRGLRATAHDEHGVIQAIEDSTERFRLGVQWHPEFMIYRAAQRRLFKAFVAAVDERFGGDPRAS